MIWLQNSTTMMSGTLFPFFFFASTNIIWRLCISFGQVAFCILLHFVWRSDIVWDLHKNRRIHVGVEFVFTALSRVCVPSGILLNIEAEFRKGYVFYLRAFLLPESESSPDDHNYAVKDIVGVFDVAKGPIHQNLQQHLQRKQAGEYDVADLQGVGQLLRLKRQKDKQGGN